MMNKIIKSRSVLHVILLLQSCLLFTECRDHFNRTYVLENETNHEIQVDFYGYNRFRYARHVEGKGVITEGVADNDNGGWPTAAGALGADSVVVIYNSKKQQIYILYTDDSVGISPSYRNILVDSAYTVESNERYRFTFTEEDYNNAEEIGD